MERLLEVTDPRALKSRIQDATSLLTPEELKELKLEASANWPPRTKPQEGEGYIFFQGPTPKTGTQPGLASFFDDLQAAPQRFSLWAWRRSGTAGYAGLRRADTAPD